MRSCIRPQTLMGSSWIQPWWSSAAATLACGWSRATARRRKRRAACWETCSGRATFVRSETEEHPERQAAVGDLVVERIGVRMVEAEGEGGGGADPGPRLPADGERERLIQIAPVARVRGRAEGEVVVEERDAVEGIERDRAGQGRAPSQVEGEFIALGVERLVPIDAGRAAEVGED